MKRAEVIATAKRVQAIAWRGAGRKFKPPPWDELASEQRGACLAVAKWYLRHLMRAALDRKRPWKE